MTNTENGGKTFTIIALGSQSAVKLRAVEEAVRRFSLNAKIVPVQARSGVSEQPFEHETVLGARHRAVHAAQIVPQADLSLAIESGLFFRDEQWFDIAIVVARNTTGAVVQVESEGCVFPTSAVEEVKRRGGEWTVGKVLVEMELATQHDDPHRDLVGRSRWEFISQAVSDLFEQLFRD